MKDDAELCIGKVPFESLEAAKKVTNRSKHRIHSLRRVPYRCHVCGKYHLGTKTNHRKADIRALDVERGESDD